MAAGGVGIAVGLLVPGPGWLVALSAGANAALASTTVAVSIVNLREASVLIEELSELRDRVYKQL
jgi:hypothetical protein